MKTITTSLRDAAVPSPHHAITITTTALVLGMTLVASGAADAARFGVRVIDVDGQAVAGASVCIGLAGNYSQFGTVMTDGDGRTELVEVPEVPFVVTASKARFSGLRTEEPARGFSLVRELTLTDEGMPGPLCHSGDASAANPPAIDVSYVAVVSNGTSTTLKPRASGGPGEYRIALDDGFEGAEWRAYDTTIELPRALADARSVVLQLRRVEGGVDSSLESRSDVVPVRIPRGASPADS